MRTVHFLKTLLNSSSFPRVYPRKRFHLLARRNIHLQCQFCNKENANVAKSTVLSESPFDVVREDLSLLVHELKMEMTSSEVTLQHMSRYYLDGRGKLFRPALALLMAGAVNRHVELDEKLQSTVTHKQRRVGLIAEMFHAASLIHDDVIDNADMRRGKPSINVTWDQKKCVLTGDFVLAVASVTLARLRHPDVIIVLSQILSDLVRGEFMQLGAAESESQRFSQYLQKTYLKTASLFANTCKAVTMFSTSDTELQQQAFLFGKHLGIAFQLVDDLLDLVSSTQQLGKPAVADLQLGLATAPVLFAAQQFPQLNPLIMRRFSQPGDVTTALELVNQSNGLSETRLLAEKHGEEATKIAENFRCSPYRDALLRLTRLVLERDK